MNGFTACSLRALWNDDAVIIGRVLAARLVRTFGLPRLVRARQAAENIDLEATAMAGTIRLMFWELLKMRDGVFTPRLAWWNVVALSSKSANSRRWPNHQG